MKTLITIILTVLFALGSSCVTATIKPTEIKPEPIAVCVPSTIAAPGDQYSYQGDIDPQIIPQTWIHIPELLLGTYKMAELAFKNPDSKSELKSALLLMGAGNCVAYSYLKDGKAHMFIYDGPSACYKEDKTSTLAAKREFLGRLFKAAYFER